MSNSQQNPADGPKDEPVDSLEALGGPSIVDREARIGDFIVRALDTQGQLVDGALIRYSILDPEGTGTAFIPTQTGHPITDTFGVTNAGYALPLDPCFSGSTSGDFIIRVTTANAARGDLHADYNVFVTARTPSRIDIVGGSGASGAPGDRVRVDFAAKLFGDDGEPITWGWIKFYIEDPHGTGSSYLSGGTVPVGSVAVSVDQEGYAHTSGEVVFGNGAPGSSFMFRAMRNDGVFADLEFKTTS